MKFILPVLGLVLVIGITGCSSTSTGRADYTGADRNAPAPVPQGTTSDVSTPEPAPIQTKSTPEGTVLNHNSPDQPLYTR